MATEFLQNFFELNRFIILFLYGQVFFILGLSIYLQSRRYSRLKLARHLRWLAAFGIFHGLHEWGLVFIPLQAAYLSDSAITFLNVVHMALLALSFLYLLKFGLGMLDAHATINFSLFILPTLWMVIFIYVFRTNSDVTAWMDLSSLWARYLLGLPASITAAWGLYKFTREVDLFRNRRCYRYLQVAGISLLTYAVFGGLIVPDESFFPANILNYTLIESIFGIPVEVYRSVIGLILAFSMIRAMDIFEIEVDDMIEQMEISTIQQVERDRIGQEIHDGVLQSIYSASLITGSLANLAKDDLVLSDRITQVKDVLNSAILELRGYMVSLRIPKFTNSLKDEIENLINQPRFTGLLNITLDILTDDIFSPDQKNHVYSITQESLSNIVRHAGARNTQIVLIEEEGEYILSITDDGAGFDERMITRGYGLQAICDHTQLLGGVLEVVSVPEQGTIIAVRFGEHS